MRWLVPTIFFVSGAFLVAGPAFVAATSHWELGVVSLLGVMAFIFGCAAEISHDD